MERTHPPLVTHRVATNVLRLRPRANLNGGIIGRLPRNTPLEVVDGPDEAGWTCVVAHMVDGDLSGWTNADHIEPMAWALPEEEPAWLALARTEINAREYTEPTHSPRIPEYHKTTTGASPDTVSWCSAFVNWCMVGSGAKGTGSNEAHSWLEWGRALNKPRYGCVVIFRDRANASGGHVAFFLERQWDMLHVLGGTPYNQVKVTAYSEVDVLGLRWAM